MIYLTTVPDSSTLLTPGLLQHNFKKYLTVREYLVAFLALFFRKFDKKIAKCNSPGVSTKLRNLP